MECIPSFFLLWLFTSCAFTHFLLLFPQHFALHQNTGSVAPVWKNLASVYGRVLQIHCLVSGARKKHVVVLQWMPIVCFSIP